MRDAPPSPPGKTITEKKSSTTASRGCCATKVTPREAAIGWLFAVKLAVTTSKPPRVKISTLAAVSVLHNLLP